MIGGKTAPQQAMDACIDEYNGLDRRFSRYVWCVVVARPRLGIERIHGQPTGQLQGQRRQKYQVRTACLRRLTFRVCLARSSSRVH